MVHCVNLEDVTYTDDTYTDVTLMTEESKSINCTGHNRAKGRCMLSTIIEPGRRYNS